jgi:UDP-N-acetyl-D-mannosaminuronate dehydrogenase
MGLAIDHAKVENLIRGKTFIHRTPSASVAEEVQAGRFLASPDVLRVCKSHALVICVPTQTKPLGLSGHIPHVPALVCVWFNDYRI